MAQLVSSPPDLFRELGCDVVELYCDSDPSFLIIISDPVK